jgi:hypothetical protein
MCLSWGVVVINSSCRLESLGNFLKNAHFKALSETNVFRISLSDPKYWYFLKGPLMTHMCYTVRVKTVNSEDA